MAKRPVAGGMGQDFLYKLYRTLPSNENGPGVSETPGLECVTLVTVTDGYAATKVTATHL